MNNCFPRQKLFLQFTCGYRRRRQEFRSLFLPVLRRAYHFLQGSNNITNESMSLAQQKAHNDEDSCKNSRFSVFVFGAKWWRWNRYQAKRTPTMYCVRRTACGGADDIPVTFGCSIVLAYLELPHSKRFFVQNNQGKRLKHWEWRREDKTWPVELRGQQRPSVNLTSQLLLLVSRYRLWYILQT